MTGPHPQLRPAIASAMGRAKIAMAVSRAISLGLMLSMAGLLWGGLNLTVGGSIGALNGWSSSAQWRFEEYSKPVE